MINIWGIFAILSLAASLPLSGFEPGDIIVADTIADAVILIEPSVTRNGQARQTILFQGPPLLRPRGVVLDAAGDVLVADELAGAVFKITGGQVQAKYGTAPLEKPYGITLDAAEKIYVTDIGTGRLVSIDPRSGVTQLVCGNLRFQAPRGLAFSADGTQLAVADYSALPHDHKGNVETLGALVRVILDGCETEPPLTVNVQNPNGVARDAGGNYDVSLQSASEIVHIDATGNVSPLSSASQFQGPRGLALGLEDQILLADYVAGTVFEVDPQSGEVTRTFAGVLLRGPNDVAVMAGSSPPSNSTFAVEDGDLYVWQITAIDLITDDTPLTLAALMNRLVFEAGEPQVRDLVEILTANNDFWWFEIQRFQQQGARIEGRFTSPDSFEITSVSGL